MRGQMGSNDDQGHPRDASDRRCAINRVGLRRNSRQHLRCASHVAFVQDLAAIASFDGATAAVLDRYRREVEAAAEGARVRFEETRQREGRSAESMVLTAAAVGIPELLARTARRFDLTILPQADPQGEGSEKAMIEAVLLGSGRPILIVPYFQEGGVKFERVLVCWDGSHNAARAIADAMPFLTCAKQVEVITVVPDRKRMTACVDHLLRITFLGTV